MLNGGPSKKIGDITDNKRTSKLTKTHSEIGEALKPEIPAKGQRLKPGNLMQKTPPQTFKRVLDMSLDHIVLSVEQFQRN